MWQLKTRCTLIAAIIALAGCSPGQPMISAPITLSASETGMAEQAIAGRLRDPGSAQFREITGYALEDGSRIICGEVNARNGFGGYAGFSPFYVRIRNGEVLRLYNDDTTGYGAATIGCTRAAEGLIAVSG